MNAQVTPTGGEGQDQVTGLPKPVTLTTGEIVEALETPLKAMVETARRTLERTPPELVSDIIDRGVALCGGGALLRGIDKLLTKSLGIPAYLVDNPMTCVVEGAVKAWKDSLAAATAPDQIKGPARVHSMFDTRDQVARIIEQAFSQ